MRKLLLILTLALASCGVNDANQCPELEFERFASYGGNEVYHFEGMRYYSAEERLDLTPGQTYEVCVEDNVIISIR